MERERDNRKKKVRKARGREVGSGYYERGREERSVK